MPYLGNLPGVTTYALGVDRFSANGSGKTFTLSRDIDSALAVDVHLSGVWQEPITAYTVNNGVITFITTPPVGSNNIVAVFRDSAVVNFNQVATSQIEEGAVTASKLALGAVTGAISSGQITGNLIATTSIRANQIVAGTITGNLIATTSIRGNQIATGTLTGNLFTAGTITGDLIGQSAINANNIALLSIIGADIAASTITGDKLALASISGNAIIANTISGNIIGQGAISTNNFSSNLIISGLTVSGNGPSGNGLTVSANATFGNISVPSGIITGNVVSPFLLGVNQTMTDMTLSRAIATTYTNTTGRPILIFVNITGSGVVQWFIGGTSIGTNAGNGIITLYIPAGSTYQATLSSGSQTLTSWFELR